MTLQTHGSHQIALAFQWFGQYQVDVANPRSEVAFGEGWRPDCAGHSLDGFSGIASSSLEGGWTCACPGNPAPLSDSSCDTFAGIVPARACDRSPCHRSSVSLPIGTAEETSHNNSHIGAFFVDSVGLVPLPFLQAASRGTALAELVEETRKDTRRTLQEELNPIISVWN